MHAEFCFASSFLIKCGYTNAGDLMGVRSVACPFQGGRKHIPQYNRTEDLTDTDNPIVWLETRSQRVSENRLVCDIEMFHSKKHLTFPSCRPPDRGQRQTLLPALTQQQFHPNARTHHAIIPDNHRRRWTVSISHPYGQRQRSLDQPRSTISKPFRASHQANFFLMKALLRVTN